MKNGANQKLYHSSVLGEFINKNLYHSSVFGEFIKMGLLKSCIIPLICSCTCNSHIFTTPYLYNIFNLVLFGYLPGLLKWKRLSFEV